MTADLLDDYDDLAPRVIAFLTDDEHREVTELYWHLAHPHPLGVERQETGACYACNTPFEAGEVAMVLDGSDSTKGAWCYGCVTIVVDAMRVARGS